MGMFEHRLGGGDGVNHEDMGAGGRRGFQVVRTASTMALCMCA